jgi:hypothetical protein
MSFAVVLNSASPTNVVQLAANNGHTFDVDLRQMIPPASLRKPYKMRFAMTSASAPAFSNTDGGYWLQLTMKGTSLRVQENKIRSFTAGILFTSNQTTNAADSFCIDTRAADNHPVIIESLNEVSQIEVQIFQGIAADTTVDTADYVLILHFEECDDC